MVLINSMPCLEIKYNPNKVFIININTHISPYRKRGINYYNLIAINALNKLKFF